MASARGLASRLLPPPIVLFNHFGNRLPYQWMRIGIARSLGVAMADRRRVAFMWGAELWGPRNVRLGVGVVIGRRVVLDARGGITVGNNVNVSSYVQMQTAKHLVDDPGFPAVFEPITIGDRVWVGQGATILGGVVVGEGAVVAANATVTKDVPPYAIVGGTPATVLRYRAADQQYTIHYRPNWL